MKKKSLTGLVVLMGFSLLGIILVQFFWMNNAINVRKEKFNATIYDALYATVKRAQYEQQANYFLQQHFSFGGNGSVKSQNDTLQNNIPYFPQPGETEQQTDKKDTSKEINNNNYLPKGLFETRIEIQTNGKPKQVIYRKKNIDYNNLKEVNEVENTIKSIEDSIRRLIQNDQDPSALNYYNQFTYEFEMRSSDISQRVDIDNLTKILNYELDARGINLDYEYAIINRRDGTLTNMASGDYNRDESNFKFVANLFPNDIFRTLSNFALDIYFPHQEQFIYKSLGILLGSSVIFTLFILLTFSFTLKTILNQKKLSEIKTDFINNMTHEFKTPIATINLATDNIANPMILNKPEHISPFLKIIKEENKRMNNQVERVLQMSLIEKSEFQLMPVKTDVHLLINEAVNKMKLLAEQKSAEITTNLKADFTVYNVDEIHFTNIIVNLLENALKYSKETPEISIDTCNNKNDLEIYVKDNGIGMSKEQQVKIFEKFYRATKGNIHNVKGFGLGLSYVKAILDQHGGSIFVKSKLGEGSTFKLILPGK